MKKWILILAAGLVAGVASAVTPFASTVTINNTSGTYTNTRDYYAEKLVSVEAFNASATTGTVTITRIRDGRTNTVGSITLSSGAGIYRETNTTWLFKGDVLRMTHSAGATGSVIEITGELPQ